MFTHRMGAVLSLLVILPFAAPACADEPPKGPLPRLVDLGATKCIPCKKMAPILEELKKDYAGIVDVVFVDVWKDPNAGKPYNIRAIPTQVFFDRSGKEAFRHVGFFSREDIEKVFKEKFGITPVRKSIEEGSKESSSLLCWEPPALSPSERTCQEYL